jgi:hypothetical protein
MKSKKTIIDKTVYGGTLVDKYFFIFDDGTDMQVPLKVWDEYEIGTIFYIKDIPDEFENAMDDIKEGKTVPLDKALNEKPSNSWEELFDMQTKLVTHYVLENEKLKDKIKELEKLSEKVDKICNQIQDIYDKKEYYRMHSHILETANDELARANKMMENALVNIWECFEIRSEIYHNDWVGLQSLANKARICLEEIGYEWRNDKKDNKS